MGGAFDGAAPIVIVHLPVRVIVVLEQEVLAAIDARFPAVVCGRGAVQRIREGVSVGSEPDNDEEDLLDLCGIREENAGGAACIARYELEIGGLVRDLFGYVEHERNGLLEIGESGTGLGHEGPCPAAYVEEGKLFECEPVTG